VIYYDVAGRGEESVIVEGRVENSVPAKHNQFKLVGSNRYYLTKAGWSR